MDNDPNQPDGRQQADPISEPRDDVTGTPRATRAANGHARAATVDEVGAAAAVSFLARFHPGAPWALASFGPGDNEIGPARTFNPSGKDVAYRFILGLQGKHNVYFTVNGVRVRLMKKAAKTDIADIHYLHVDADLPKSLNWSDPAAVAAAKEQVLQQLRSYGPPPTAIIWSGGGFQAFWRLSEIITVNGDKEKMAHVERRMRRIEQTFHADACHNVDRIMRLPGTINVLGPTKVRAGRKPERAELIEFHDDRIYDLEDFPEIEPEPSGPANGTGQHGGHDWSLDPDDFERARDALRAVPADDYSPYLRIGMALKSGFGDAGFDLYCEWAAKSSKFTKENIDAKWKSIKGEGGVTLATLFFMARQHGWREAQPQSESAAPADAPPEPDMSIVRRNRMPAPVFPVEVFGDAADWVKAVAESKSAPVDYPALGLIVVAGAMIGPKRCVSPWEDWEEPSIIWGVIVGDPSLVKSPSQDPHRDAVRALERELNTNWEDRKLAYEQEKKAAEEYCAEWERQVRQAIKENKLPPEKPKETVEPLPPTRVRLWAVDQTTEKAARILGENPEGFILFRDELAGWLGGFDKYGGSGGDRAFWIETYGGRPYRYERVSLDDPIDIQFCAVSVLGSIQPDRLNTMLLSGDDDGLAARPLYAWPDPVPPRKPKRSADREAIRRALRRLRSLTFDTDALGNAVPRIKLLEPDAADEFQSWWEYKQWDAKLSAAGRLAGAIGKLDGVALRIAQVLELLQWAWGGSNQPEPDRVSLQSVKNALRIIDNWVRPTLERVFAEAALPQAQRDAMAVGRWLLKTKPKTVNARELRRQPGFTGPKEAKELDVALEYLVDAHWLFPKPIEGRGPAPAPPGRPRKDYTVNPRIYET
jgi:hypothetical protein